MSRLTMKLFSSNLVHIQTLPYDGARNIRLKFKMVVIWTKFDTSIQNEMPMIIRK